MDKLLLFDIDKPKSSGTQILVYTVVIIVASNIISMVLCAIMGINPGKQIEQEKNKEYKDWKDKNVKVSSLFFTELFNTTLYSPIAEELIFRFFLMNIVFVKTLKININVANILQATIFGGIHATNNIYTTQTSVYTKLQIISSAVSGLVSGWVYTQCNSILPCVFAHIINNGIAGMSEVIGYYKYLKNN